MILEDAERSEENRSEMLAELGSSAYHEGWSSVDAMYIAQGSMAAREEDFRQSEEGELYFARLDAARLYEDLPVLTEWSIPEFVDGKTSWDHSPFAAHYTAPTFDDIPF